MVAYATAPELSAFLPAGVEVDDAARLLERASSLVARACRAGFATDQAGQPTDDTVAAALREAVCAQVEQWAEVGESNDVDGLAGSQISVPGYSGGRAPRLAPRALDAIMEANLHQPWPQAGTFPGGRW